MRRQTELLRDTPRTAADFRAAARTLKTQQPPAAFSDVRVCPLLGFIDSDARRVGCLGHPKVTGGADLRDCGVYDAKKCESFECPSFIWLEPDQAELVRAACPDWYLYGLIITDVELVRGVLRLLANDVGRHVTARQVLDRPAALRAIASLFGLKASITDGEHVFGQFEPGPDGEPELRQLRYSALGADTAPEDGVLLCLGFLPRSLAALESSRRAIRERISEAAAALSK